MDLQAGPDKACALSNPFTDSLGDAVGLRNVSVQPVKTIVSKAAKLFTDFKHFVNGMVCLSQASMMQEGTLLIQSRIFISLQPASQAIDARF